MRPFRVFGFWCWKSAFGDSDQAHGAKRAHAPEDLKRLTFAGLKKGGRRGDEIPRCGAGDERLLGRLLGGRRPGSGKKVFFRTHVVALGFNDHANVV